MARVGGGAEEEAGGTEASHRWTQGRTPGAAAPGVRLLVLAVTRRGGGGILRPNCVWPIPARQRVPFFCPTVTSARLVCFFFYFRFVLFCAGRRARRMGGGGGGGGWGAGRGVTPA